MKHLYLALSLLSAVLTAQADELKLADVHLCCGGCVKGAEKAVAKVGGATATVDKDAGTVIIAAASKDILQQAVASLQAAGYYGKSSDATVKVAATAGVPEGKVQKLKVEGVHLCCGKCVTAVQKAVSRVAGVKANTAEKNVATFEVTGDFNAKDVFAELNKSGLSGRVAK
ncbi:MAG: hypothetical protein B9S33_06980 [Pedosphaera sp. Tous-C6FEB]|nr:MAG: hypothetical protein B9S33_06980 [Pedosphaera sp. Tous-C6FEB]